MHKISQSFMQAIVFIACFLSVQLFSQSITRYDYPVNTDSAQVFFMGKHGANYLFISRGYHGSSPLNLLECNASFEPVKEKVIGKGNFTSAVKFSEDSFYVVKTSKTSETLDNLEITYYGINGEMGSTRVLATNPHVGPEDKIYRNFFEFNMDISPDSSRFLYYYGGNRVKDQNAKIEVLILARNGREIHKKEIVFPYTDKALAFENVDIGNNGSLLFTARICKKERSEQTTHDFYCMSKHTVQAFYYDPATAKLSKQDLFEYKGDDHLENIRVQYNGFENRFDICALHSSASNFYSPEYDSIYFYSYYADNHITFKKLGWDTAVLRPLSGTNKMKYVLRYKPSNVVIEGWEYFKTGEIAILAHQKIIVVPAYGDDALLPDMNRPLSGGITVAPLSGDNYNRYTHNMLCMVYSKNLEHKISKMLPSGMNEGVNYWSCYDGVKNEVILVSHSTIPESKSSSKYNNYLDWCAKDKIEPNKIFITTASSDKITTQSIDCEFPVIMPKWKSSFDRMIIFSGGATRASRCLLKLKY